jgi:hypothetical protein
MVVKMVVKKRRRDLLYGDLAARVRLSLRDDVPEGIG